MARAWARPVLLCSALLVVTVIAALATEAGAKVINCAHNPRECEQHARPVPLLENDASKDVEKAMIDLPHWLIAFISVTPSVCFFGLQLSGWPTIQRIQCVMKDPLVFGRAERLPARRVPA